MRVKSRKAEAASLCKVVELRWLAYLPFASFRQQVRIHFLHRYWHCRRYLSYSFCLAGATHALGIDTLQSLFPDKDPKLAGNAVTAAGRKKLQDAEDAFQSSDILKKLKEQTATNSKKYYTALPLCIACIYDVSMLDCIASSCCHHVLSHSS